MQIVAQTFSFCPDFRKVSVSLLPDRVDSEKLEELKTVKLEEEEQEAAVLDLSISHASNSTSVLPASKQSATSSVQSSSPAYSSDSESSDLLAKRTLPGPAGLFTVHSYAKGDASSSDNEQTSGRKASATSSVSEQELTEVRMVKELKAEGREFALTKFLSVQMTVSPHCSLHSRLHLWVLLNTQAFISKPYILQALQVSKEITCLEDFSKL